VTSAGRTLKPVTISWSEVDTYRQCPHKHQLTYKERWVGKTTSPSLQRGSLYHKVMEGHYRSLMERPGDLVAARRQAETWWAEWRQEWGDEETAELVWWMYEGYIDLYGADDDWDIRGVEQKLEVPLLTAGGNRSRFTLKMQIDLIVRDRSMGNKLLIIDHKTGADLPSRKQLDMADQFGFYLWGMRQLGHDVFGGVWNGARTRRLKTKEQPLRERFSRPMLARTDHELTTIAQEAYQTARKAYAAGAVAERHPDADTCQWKCGFLEACLLGRKTSDAKEREFLEDSGYVVDHTRH
jgi:hypothetical protein